MARHNEFGKKGEELAATWLAGQGYKIVARNWHRGRYEVDIIARLEETLHFIEVKTGRTCKYGYPEERVGKKKIRDLMKAGAAWLYQFPGQWQVRYDVLAVSFESGNEPEYLLIEDVHC